MEKILKFSGYTLQLVYSAFLHPHNYPSQYYIHIVLKVLKTKSNLNPAPN